MGKIDMGKNSKCCMCNKRDCKCPERQLDGSWNTEKGLKKRIEMAIDILQEGLDFKNQLKNWEKEQLH